MPKDLKTKKGSLSIFFLAFAIICFALISFSVFVSERVHHQIRLTQAADSAARAAAAQAAQGLNMISANNLAIAATMQINNSLLLMGYYHSIIGAFNYSFGDILSDIGSYFEGKSSGFTLQGPMDKYAPIGKLFYQMAQGSTSLNKDIRDHWLSLAPAQAIEFAKLNDPGALTFAFRGEGAKSSNLPFTDFTYSNSDPNLDEQFLFTSTPKDTICLTTANSLGDGGSKTDAIGTWISGPLLTTPVAPSDTIDKISTAIEAFNTFTPVRFGLIECGMALKTPLFDVLKSGLSETGMLGGAVISDEYKFGTVLTTYSVVDRIWDAGDSGHGKTGMFSGYGNGMCNMEKLGQRIALGFMSTVGTLGKWGYDESIESAFFIEIMKKAKKNANECDRVLALECAKDKYQESKTITTLVPCTGLQNFNGHSNMICRYGYEDKGMLNQQECLSECEKINCTEFSHRYQGDQKHQCRIFKHGETNLGDLASWFTQNCLHGGYDNYDYYVRNECQPKLKTITTKSCQTKCNQCKTEGKKICDKMRIPTIRFSTKDLKYCKMDSCGNLPAGCDEKFVLTENTWKCPWIPILMNYVAGDCCTEWYCPGSSHYPSSDARIWRDGICGSPNSLNSYFSFVKQSKKMDKNSAEYVPGYNNGTQFISWGRQAEYFSTFNMKGTIKESTLGFMVINKNHVLDFYQRIAMRVLLLSPIWSPDEVKSLSNCTNHTYTSKSGKTKCRIERYLQLMQMTKNPPTSKQGKTDFALASGGLGSVVNDTIFKRMQWAISSYKPSFYPAVNDPPFRHPSATPPATPTPSVPAHLTTLWPAWGVSPSRVRLSDFSKTNKKLTFIDNIAGAPIIKAEAAAKTVLPRPPEAGCKLSLSNKPPTTSSSTPKDECANLPPAPESNPNIFYFKARADASDPNKTSYTKINIISPRPKFQFKNCYQDTESRNLKSAHGILTIDQCADKAITVGHTYFGLQDQITPALSEKIGCYHDKTTDRDLPTILGTPIIGLGDSTEMVGRLKETCRALASSNNHNFTYFGLQFHNTSSFKLGAMPIECRGGNNYGKHGATTCTDAGGNLKQMIYYTTPPQETSLNSELAQCFSGNNPGTTTKSCTNRKNSSSNYMGGDMENAVYCVDCYVPIKNGTITECTSNPSNDATKTEEFTIQNGSYSQQTIINYNNNVAVYGTIPSAIEYKLDPKTQKITEIKKTQNKYYEISFDVKSQTVKSEEKTGTFSQSIDPGNKSDYDKCMCYATQQEISRKKTNCLTSGKKWNTISATCSP